MIRLFLFLATVFVSSSAYACITPILQPPKDTASAEQQAEFTRDEQYYNALVSDFCTVDPTPMTDKEKEINQKIRDLLLERWQQPEMVK